MDTSIATIIAAIIGAVATILTAILITIIQGRKDVTKDHKKAGNFAEIQADSKDSVSTIKKPIISSDDEGVEHQVGNLISLPPRRKLEINKDVVVRAALKEKIERSDSWAKIARNRTSLYSLLEWYYNPQGYPLFERYNPVTKENMKYPVTVIKAKLEQQNDPESILGELDPTKKEEDGKQTPFVITDDWGWYQKMALRPDNYHDDGIKYIMTTINKDPFYTFHSNVE